MNTHHDSLAPARRRAVAAAAATLVASASWAAGAAPPDADSFARIGAELPIAEFHADRATAASTRSRASGFASLLAGERVVAGGSVMQRPPSQVQFEVRSEGGIATLAEAPRARSAVRHDTSEADAVVAARALAATAATGPLERIRIVVDNERRDVLAVNGAVADDFAAQADLGPERAGAVFETTLRSLSANGLVRDEGLAPEALRTHRLMQGEQAVGQAPVTRVKEYLFEVPHALGGIEIFGAATTVAVHRSGQLASIRTHGPTVRASPTGATATRRVSTQALARRAAAENPDARIVPVGLRFPWQATGDATLAAHPREVFQVIPTTLVDGHAVNGRAHFVFYSVEDEAAAPLVWPRPDPHATGDVRR